MKLFNCIPLRTSTVPAHITLDTASIIDLLKPKILDENGDQYSNSYLLGHISSSQDKVWEAIIKNEPKKQQQQQQPIDKYLNSHHEKVIIFSFPYLQVTLVNKVQENVERVLLYEVLHIY